MEVFEYVDREVHSGIIQSGLFTNITYRRLMNNLNVGDKFIVIPEPNHHRNFTDIKTGAHILFTVEEIVHGDCYKAKGWGDFSYDVCWKLETFDK